MILRIVLFLAFFFLSVVEARIVDDPALILLKEKKVLTQLEKLQRRMQKTVKERSHLDQQLMFTRNHHEGLAAQINELRETLKSKQKNFFSHYFLFKSLQSSKTIDHLIISKNPGHLDRKAKLLEIYTQQSFDQMNENAKIMSELQVKEFEYITRVKDVETLMFEIKKQEIALRKEMEIKKRILEFLQKKKSLAFQDHKKVKAYLKSQGQDENLLDRIFLTSFQDLKGKIQWPFNGQVEKNLGYQFDKNEKIQMLSQGVFISTKEITSVTAIGDGSVKLVENIPGMGMTVVLDHGDHFLSVYSGLKDVSLTMDEVVKKQQIIGMTNESIYHNKNGAYFELRHFGEPLSLAEWLSPEKIKKD